MPRQQSQQNGGATARSPRPPQLYGRLYVVAVPIGHPDDITIRAMKVLSTVRLIASENPTATQQLLRHHSIHTTVTSYGPLNLEEKVQVLLHHLQQGADMALVSDCGSPLVVDPGRLLVKAAQAHAIQVVPVPGPSALLAAITVSGLIGDAFSFYGRLPTTQSRMTRLLTEGLQNRVPLIVFCTTPTATQALHILETIAPRRMVTLACDLTTANERVIQGTPRFAREQLFNAPSHDVTLIVGGKSTKASPSQSKRSAQSLSSRRIKTR